MEGWDTHGRLGPVNGHAWKVGTGERQLGATVTHGRLGPANGSLVQVWTGKRQLGATVTHERLGTVTVAWCHSATGHSHAWKVWNGNGSLVPQCHRPQSRMEGWDRQTVAWCHSHAWDSQAWKVGTGERQLGATRPANGSLVQVWTGKRQLGATVTHGRLGPANGSSVPRTANGSSVPRTEVWDRSKRCHSHAWKVGTRMEGWDR